MATTATVRSNRKDKQASPETPAKDPLPQTSSRSSRAGRGRDERFISFVTISLGCGILGATFNSGWTTLAGVFTGAVLGWALNRK